MCGHAMYSQSALMTARNTGKRDWCKASLPQALTEAESPVVKARFTELIEYLRIEH